MDIILKVLQTIRTIKYIRLDILKCCKESLKDIISVFLRSYCDQNSFATPGFNWDKEVFLALFIVMVCYVKPNFGPTS